MSQGIRLFLVRHGNTFEADQTATQVGLKTDLPLTQQGREQAAQVAEYFKKQKITPKAVYSGKLKRQKESAHIVHSALGGQLYLNEAALNEIDYGLWEGLTTEQITHQWLKEYTDWSEQAKWPAHIFEGSFTECKQHLKTWIEKIIRDYQEGDTVICFTSQGLIRFFYTFLPDEWERLTAERKMHDLRVKTGHFCELELNPRSLTFLVRGWNLSPRFW